MADAPPWSHPMSLFTGKTPLVPDDRPDLLVDQLIAEADHGWPGDPRVITQKIPPAHKTARTTAI